MLTDEVYRKESDAPVFNEPNVTSFRIVLDVIVSVVVATCRTHLLTETKCRWPFSLRYCQHYCFDLCTKLFLKEATRYYDDFFGLSTCLAVAVD